MKRKSVRKHLTCTLTMKLLEELKPHDMPLSYGQHDALPLVEVIANQSIEKSITI